MPPAFARRAPRARVIAGTTPELVLLTLATERVSPECTRPPPASGAVVAIASAAVTAASACSASLTVAPVTRRVVHDFEAAASPFWKVTAPARAVPARHAAGGRVSGTNCAPFHCATSFGAKPIPLI